MTVWESVADSWHWITGTVAIIDVVLVLIVVPWILSLKKEATSAVAWCLLVIFLPLFGAFLFVMFGFQSVYRPLVKKRKHRRRYREQSAKAPAIESGSEADKDDPGYEGLAKLAVKLNASNPITGNAVTFFHEGRAAFDTIFAEIEAAQHHVHLQFFIYRSDRIGKKLFELLARKARQGVEVRLLTDGVGSHRLYWWQLTNVRKAGVKVSTFLPMRLWKRVHINLRNHRKVVVVDGRVAFTGGLNIGDEYLGEDPSFGFWRDTFLRIEGPAVESLQRVFVEDWDFAASEPLKGIKYFPPEERPGDVTAQVIASGPDQDIWSIREMVFAAAMKARKRLWLMTPYFVPDQGIRDALRLAGRTGVDVRLLLPLHPDHWLSHFAGHYYLSDLMTAGVKVYLYSKGFMHSKVVMVDGQWASVGTANIDNRSLLLNFEVNCLLHTPATVALLETAFRRDLDDSKRLDPKEFARRSLKVRLAENFCRLFAPVL